MPVSFPFISRERSIVILRIGVALIFFLHAVVRLINGSMPQFATFLNEKGFVYGTIIVWILTLFEIAGSILIAINYRARCLCAGFILILLIGIVIIHASLGWFVGEHGAGGVEYSFALILALLVIAAHSKN